jgi:hypothetical protein
MADPVLQGSLSTFKLADVLMFIGNARRDGTLTVRSDGHEAYLFLHDGALVYAGSNQEHFRLGSILVRKRMITREQRDNIDALMNVSGGMFGDIAVKQGILTHGGLRDSLKIQVSEIVFDCFVWTGGEFGFQEELHLPRHAVTISVDLPNLIMEGARRIEEWGQCLALLPERDAIYRVVVRPKDEKVTLTADEWKILFLINGQRTLAELCADSEEEPLHVYRVVYGLLANKLVEPMNSIMRDDDTGAPLTGPMPAPGEDATVRQSTPRFGSESTMREAPADDTSLLLSPEPRLSYADVVRTIVAQLIVSSEGQAQRVIALTESEYLIGRHHDNDVQITDLGVSGFHARIYRGADGYVVEDMKSRNGVWVNGNRVYQATLQHGDRVHLGKTDLEYEVLL